MKSTHVLDLSQAELPSWWPVGGPVVLPVVVGRFEYDWDIAEKELPASFVDALRTGIIIRSGGHNHYAPSAMKRPVGFNNRSLPQGAVIREKQ